ncbi:MAG: serpin family protein [Actinomycetota bacterium]
MVRRRTTAALAALGLAPVVVLGGCAAPPELLRADGVARADAAAGEFPAEIDALRRSAFTLGAAMLAAAPEQNQVTGPVSLLYAVAMLRAGAGSTTADEMDRVLGLPEQNLDAALNSQLAQWEKFDGDPGSVDEDEPPVSPLMHLANGVFVDAGTPTGEGYLRILAEHYGSGVYPLDYSDPSTKQAMDAWVDHHTGGRITEAPGGYHPDNTLTLLNAVYFAAAWEQPFDPSATEDADFTTASGERVSVPMMGNLVQTAYARGKGWQGMDLPYGDGFVMRLILPDGGTPVMDQAGLLDVATVMDGADEAMVVLELPRWNHTHQQDLLPILRRLGLDETFGSAPDLAAIQQDALVTGAAQQANITVGEKGTIAAAVTQLDVMSGSMPPQPDVELSFDRPFLYQIIHLPTGFPLFLGTVMDPR